MIEITFKEFFEYKYQEDGFYELYVMQNGLGDTLYVGISSQNIWNRWFGWNGHIPHWMAIRVGNLRYAQELAHHKNIQVTQRYTHLSNDELDKAYYEIFEKKTQDG
jgi:integrase